MSRIFGKSSAAPSQAEKSSQSKPADRPTRNRSEAPDYRESDTGFCGGRDYDRKIFCRRLYYVLWQEKNGFLEPMKILERLWEQGIDGTEVAERNDYVIFERLLKSPDFADVVAYEPFTQPNEQGLRWQYTFIYSASFGPGSEKFEDIRRMPTGARND